MSHISAEGRLVAPITERLALGSVRLRIPMDQRVQLTQLPVAVRELQPAGRSNEVERFLDVKAAARKTGLQQRKVQRLARRGLVVASKSGGRWLVGWNSLLAYLDLQ